MKTTRWFNYRAGVDVGLALPFLECLWSGTTQHGRSPMTARFGGILAGLCLAAVGCSTGIVGKAPSPSHSSGTESLPAIEAVMAPEMLVTRYVARFYPDGTVNWSVPGSSGTTNIGPAEVARLVEQLQERGFFNLSQEALLGEYLACALSITNSDGSVSARGLAVADGITEKLTVRRGSATTSVEWQEPELYTNSYPSARLMRRFVECVDAVWRAVPYQKP